MLYLYSINKPVNCAAFGQCLTVREGRSIYGKCRFWLLIEVIGFEHGSAFRLLAEIETSVQPVHKLRRGH